MSDAFKNYSNLISSLASSRDEEANTNLTYHQTKAGIDSMSKILGETKIFLSGKPAMEKIGKKILKPLYNKYGKQYVNKLNQKIIMKIMTTGTDQQKKNHQHQQQQKKVLTTGIHHMNQTKPHHLIPVETLLRRVEVVHFKIL